MRARWVAPVRPVEELPSRWPVLLRAAIGVALVVHGVAHLEMVRVWGARESATTWLLGTADGLGTVLSTVSLLGFVASGLAVLAGLAAWRRLAIASASVSLVTIALFWDPRMAPGAVVDLVILAVLLRAGRTEGGVARLGHR